jgi:outer membrane lipoprotein-sorting protein
VRLLRTLSTSRLVVLLAAVAALAAGVGAVAVAASGGGGATPPTKPLAQALHDSLAGTEPDGVTARIKFTNNLFPSGALSGRVGSALMSGASGRLWVTKDGRGRLELQSDAGDVQVVWNQNEATIFDASSNTVYRATLPEQADTRSDSTGIPTLDEITSFLTRIGTHVTLSAADPVNVGGQPAYSVRISPKHDGGLLGAAEFAWDAARAVPLRLGVYAQGASSPVLELAATDISYGPVAAGDVAIAPPSSATVVDLGDLGNRRSSQEEGAHAAQATGLEAVQAAAPFPVVAPAKLVGLPRQDVRLVGGSESKSVVVVYGQGLGAIVVVEREAHTESGPTGVLGALPEVSLDGVTAHELATQLGTALAWNRSGVAFVLAGSVPPAAAEAAARALG